ncbi:MAG: cohesin domain-containing protein [Patescibacteria group bacterium]|nr:cohesin domain-containing protein [Patescibacteria group bacterium]
MNIRGIKVKIVNLFREKTFILTGLFLIIVFLLSTALLIINSNKPSQQPDKTWEINLTYNSNSKKLSLEKLAVVNRKTVPDLRNALYSSYKLQVLGKNGNVIFAEKINITEKILYDIFLNAPESRVLIPADIKSVIFVPYQADGVRIVILRNNNTVLQINLPKTTASNFIQSAEALTQSSISCGPITTVFINDNYKNTAQFKADVAYLKNLYNTIPPYNTNPSVFEFQEVDAPQNFGCASSGVTSCMNNLQGAIKNSALRYFPNAQKFIVLVDNPNALTVDGGIAGLVNGIGGDVMIYTNYTYADAGPVSGQPFAAAPHELEGHAVGYLWDRYVSSDTNYAAIARGDVMSNCSTNPQGEAFWKNSGSTGAFGGCGNQNQYAPFPLTCKSNTKGLISGGTNNTIMSAIGCSRNEFDQVEQAWITNNILPNYKACPTRATTNVKRSTTINFNPTPQTVTINGTVNLDIMLNPGTNQVSFTKLVINYDPTKLSVLPAGPAICPAKPTDAFCPNTLAFPVVMQGPIYSSGTISVTLSVGGGPTNVIQVSTKIATVTFKAIAPTGPSATQVTVNVPQSQALSIASTDQFNENILSSANPAIITITGTNPSPTPTPSASAAPTPSASSSPTPSSAPTYNCTFDQATCDSGKSSIQMCFLKCTSN